MEVTNLIIQNIAAINSCVGTIQDFRLPIAVLTMKTCQ